MKFANVAEMLNAVRPAMEVTDTSVKVTDAATLRGDLIDRLVNSAVFGDDAVKSAARWIIWNAAWDLGARSASVYDLYMARARGEYSDVTLPAINIRALSYDMARAVMRAAKSTQCGTFITELARSEMGYTDQTCDEFAAVVSAAAIKEGHVGPIFMQGDHYQANVKRFKADPEKELDGLRTLIKQAVAAGFGNIDIDTSTLVDLSYDDLDKQQTDNVESCAKLAKLVRDIEPKGVTVSLGGEIGEVGKHNSTVGELNAFLNGFERLWDGRTGLSKVAINTGSTHGGVVLPDGSIAKVSIDFDVHRELGDAARGRGLAGTVQHGASTLPAEAFGHFPKAGTLEVHLATEFQNMIMDSKHFSPELREEIYAWTRENCAGERKEGQSEEQFIYLNRKQAWGTFKPQTWAMSASQRAGIAGELQAKFEYLMTQLNAANTKELVGKYVKPVKIEKPMPESLRSALPVAARTS
ncbi:MAG: class II fructose-bisphosphate aldolase [Chloroflexota bacterium]